MIKIPLKMIHFTSCRTEVSSILVCLISLVRNYIEVDLGPGERGNIKKYRPGRLTPHNIWHLHFTGRKQVTISTKITRKMSPIWIL